MLLFAGLPATLANGTNRVGVLAQNLGGLAGFHRHGEVDWKWSLAASVPALAGAALGVWLALQLPNVAFKRVAVDRDAGADALVASLSRADTTGTRAD